MCAIPIAGHLGDPSTPGRGRRQVEAAKGLGAVDSAHDEDERFMAALDDVAQAAQRTIDRALLIQRSAEFIRQARSQGLAYTDVVSQQPRPLIVELLSASLKDLSETGSRWRTESARALYREGLSTAAIAEIYSVSRQRISALLSRPDSMP